MKEESKSANEYNKIDATDKKELIDDKKLRPKSARIGIPQAHLMASETKMDQSQINAKQVFKCGRCGEVFGIMADLIHHMSVIHGKGKLQKIEVLKREYNQETKDESFSNGKTEIKTPPTLKLNKNENISDKEFNRIDVNDKNILLQTS